MTRHARAPVSRNAWCTPLSVEHDHAAGLTLRTAADEVDAAADLRPGVVRPIPRELGLTRGEDAVGERADLAAGDVVDVHLYAAGVGDAESHRGRSLAHHR